MEQQGKNGKLAAGRRHRPSPRPRARPYRGNILVNPFPECLDVSLARSRATALLPIPISPLCIATQ